MSAIPNVAPHRAVRVLQVISNLEFGGAQRQVVELANALDGADFEVHVCSLSSYVPLGAELRRPDRLHVIEKRFKFDASVVPRLRRLLRRLDSDVVHSYLFDADIAVRLAARLTARLVTINSERNTDYHLKARQRVAYRLTRPWVDLIVANSRAGAEFHRRMLGHPAGAYRVVHNGVDVRRFVPRDGEAARAALGLPEASPVIGMFASFKAQKNHPLFFAAARLLLRRHPRAKFLLVGEELFGGRHGSDAYRRRMDHLVDELGLRPHCHFLGNRRDVEAIYPACHVTVLPSLFEGTPNVLIESMSCGVPVVATRVSDNAEIVPEGRVGRLVALGDPHGLAEAVESVLEEEPRRRQFGFEARRWVEREFSVQRLASRMAEVYREAMDGA